MRNTHDDTMWFSIVFNIEVAAAILKRKHARFAQIPPANNNYEYKLSKMGHEALISRLYRIELECAIKEKEKEIAERLKDDYNASKMNSSKITVADKELSIASEILSNFLQYKQKILKNIERFKAYEENAFAKLQLDKTRLAMEKVDNSDFQRLSDLKQQLLKVMKSLNKM